MIIAHHLIWTGYGWWLPNDPRGSTSRTVNSDIIAELGELHYGRKEIQPASTEIREFYRQAGTVLAHPLLELAPVQTAAVGEIFREVIVRNKYTCYACAIMPDHVHILIRKHRQKAEEIIAELQEASMNHLAEQGLCPSGHPVWTKGGWKGFLDHPDGIKRTITYINANRRKQNLPSQSWAFVTEYDNWPLHEGHSPKSPYVTRGRGKPFRS